MVGLSPYAALVRRGGGEHARIQSVALLHGSRRVLVPSAGWPFVAGHHSHSGGCMLGGPLAVPGLVEICRCRKGRTHSPLGCNPHMDVRFEHLCSDLRFDSCCDWRHRDSGCTTGSRGPAVAPTVHGARGSHPACVVGHRTHCGGNRVSNVHGAICVAWDRAVNCLGQDRGAGEITSRIDTQTRPIFGKGQCAQDPAAVTFRQRQEVG